MVQQHRGNRTISHFDAYRIRDDDEFLELGPEEYFESADLTLVEWADRVMACLPRDRLEIHIAVQDPTSRVFTLYARGESAARCLADLARQL